MALDERHTITRGIYCIILYPPSSWRNQNCNRDTDRVLATSLNPRDPECKRDRQVRGCLGFRDRATERRRLRHDMCLINDKSMPVSRPGKQGRSRAVIIRKRVFVAEGETENQNIYTRNVYKTIDVTRARREGC